jgi:CheY-like chemotaxis protein
VLILDLEMPNEDGFQVLEWLKRSGREREVRAVALAASEHGTYLTRASELGAHCCLTKPSGGATIEEFAKNLETWCHSAPPASELI